MLAFDEYQEVEVDNAIAAIRGVKKKSKHHVLFSALKGTHRSSSTYTFASSTTFHFISTSPILHPNKIVHARVINYEIIILLTSYDNH